MSTITRFYRTTIAASPHELHRWHAGPAAFERLTPPWMRVRVTDGTEGIDDGSWKQLRITLAGPVGFDWRLIHEGTANGFVDVQQQGPFAFWQHEHRFRPAVPSGSTLEDILTYELPAGGMGRLLAERPVGRTLDSLFRFRHDRTRHDMARIARAGRTRPMRIAVTGASGLVGRRLTTFLRAAGHEVLPMVRHAPAAPGQVSWNPEGQTIDAAALEGVDAVVHLAGVSIAGGLWTRARKAAIRDSRVNGTHLLARTLASMEHPPSVFVSTSAIGFYGDRGDAILTERSSGGEGFLAEVCRAWEDAAQPAAMAGIRVVNPRFGLVMAGDGGMLPLIAKAFLAGAGGPLGPGSQYMSWIAIDDLVGVLYEAITNDSLSGPVNAVSPDPVTNREFSATLGRVLHRPSFLRVPAFAMKSVAGELAEELVLVSQRAVPAALEKGRFPFQFPALEDALRAELGRYDSHPAWEGERHAGRGRGVA